MTTITCPPAEQLKAFYLGQLPDDRSDELVAHVGACSACQAELETVVDAEDSLIANLREPDDGSNLDREPACEMGMLRALGALATVYEPTTDENSGNSEEATLPKTIGEYEIVRALGQGGMGHVYLARHSKLGRLVALKILAGHRLGDRRASQRFEAEMRAIGRLSHPNIVTAHDAREIDGTAVLVTEFIDGFDLGQLLQRTGPLAIGNACEIIRQVALALQYTSDQGFVHRDVKPSNIMLSAAGEVKLLDLGLARLQFGDVESADVTGTGQTMGTADYISPEQVTDSRKVDVRSDIYSLGVTLFRLLVGRAPFADAQFNTAFAKMTAHVSTTPTTVRSLRNDVPEELSRLVASMLAKRPEDRPQKPDVIAAKLSAFTDGSNLELLARTAALVDVTQAATNSVTTSIEPKTLTQSFWHRPVKLYLAIASGLVGILLGFCFGIIITITNPDGSKTVMNLPPGSKVEVGEGEGEAKPLKNDTQAVDSKTDAFLEFGVVINPAQARLVRMVPEAGNVTLSNPLKTSHYDPKTDQKLVSIDATNSIRAEQIWGHILETQLVKTGNSNALELTFDEGLSQRLLELTSEHIGHQLAIIVEGKVVAAPQINAPIGSKAVIEGTFTQEQLSRLKEWLSAAQTTVPIDTQTKSTAPAPTFDGHTLDEFDELPRVRRDQMRDGR
ncbi:MAG: protein kinase [Pirellulaceae bacterium]|nr:protein kinase [Pirellulaceae bacterium]